MDVHPYGDSALLACFPGGMSEATRAIVSALSLSLARDRLPGLVETVPGYDSLLVAFDPFLTGHADLEAGLRRRLSLLEAGPRDPSPDDGAAGTLVLPVCYDAEFAPDMEAVSAATGLSPGEIVRLHSGADYLVWMIGFLPGFPYLGGMPPGLATPRLSSPRPRVPAGSVGIADGQTGVYPLESPGGWNLIGRTPARLFDPGRSRPSLLSAGMRLRFCPVGASEYGELSRKAARGEEVSWLA